MTISEAIEKLESANSKLGDYFPNYQNATNKIIEALKEKEQEEMDRKLEIEIETKGFDEATEKANELAEAIDDISDKFIIRNSRDCTFNFYINKR